jgi:hypothetical protein
MSHIDHVLALRAFFVEARRRRLADLAARPQMLNDVGAQREIIDSQRIVDALDRALSDEQAAAAENGG